MRAPTVPMPDSAAAPQTFRRDLLVGPPTVEGKVTISDPVNNRHYLVNTMTLSVLTRFDGARAPEQIRADLAAAGLRVSPEALDAMAAKAESLGLFIGTTAPNTPDAAHLRGPTRRSIMFFQIAETDPSRVVVALRGVGRLLFSKGAALALLLLVGWAVMVILGNTGRYVDSLSMFAVFSAWGLVYLANAAVTVLHEFGHALAVGRFGGSVHKMGVALYLFSPAAYTDTSSAWAFEKSRHRVVVSLAGVYVESFILACGIILWGADVLPPLATATLFLLGHTIAARIILNLNPFLRLDGYWLLSDALQIPNMRAKAFVVLLSSVSSAGTRRRRLAFIRTTEEKVLLLTYAVLSLVTLVVGLTVGFIALDQLARRYLEWYGAVESRIVVFVILLTIGLNLRRYVKGLREATFVGGSPDVT